MKKIYTLIALVLSIPIFCSGQTQIITLNPDKDNTLYESVAGTLSNGSGDYIFAGRTNQSTGQSIRRALLHFDIAGNLPANATIVSCTLRLNMNKTVSGAQTISLNTLTSDWGEGLSNAIGSEGSGASATMNDATWTNNFFGSSSWLTPGGDYNAISIATTSVNGNGNYDWISSGMVTDVQSWLTTPLQNRGWILLGNESASQTAKRFSSRENTSNPPQLIIEYSAPPAAAITSQPSDDVACENGFAQFAITATNASSYQWQEFTGSWANVINGGVYSGATTNSLDLAGIGTGLSGNQYRCIAINVNGNDTSNAAMLTVIPTPTVMVSPGDTAICPGDSLLLTSNIIAGASYQWYQDGQIITFATNSTYLILNTSGSFNVMVTVPGGCSDTASNPSIITLNNSPVVSISPSDTTLCNVDSLLLTGASGGTLQWFKDGSPLAGETSSTLTVSNGGIGSGSFNQMKTNTNGCSAMAATPTMVSFQLCSGVNDLEDNLAIQLFPNPVTNYLYLRSNDLTITNSQIKIVNINGQVIFKENLQGLTESIPVSSLPVGYYTLILQTENGKTIHQKFIKK